MRLLLAFLVFASGLLAQDDLDNLPRPDGEPADMSKPVQVYILMGQSNMLGFGKPDGLKAACERGLYPYLMNEDGSWTERKDVRYVRVMCSGSGAPKTHNNEWMTIRGNIGPEMGIGHYVGHVTDAPVLILKSCIGNRSLGYDLLPPSAPGYAGNPRKPRRPQPGDWYAGVQYDGDVAAALAVLDNLGKHYPGAKRYEVAGFFFWQGDKDFRNNDHAAAYEQNLLHLIESLRDDFDAPDARFVCATLGQTKKGSGGPQGQILEAQLAIDGKRGKYKSHRGKVATVYTNPLSKGGSSSGHYGGNAETYQNVGQAMGRAMAEMILAGPSGGPAGIPGVRLKDLDGTLTRVHKQLVAGKWNEAEKVLRPYLADAKQPEPAKVLDEYLRDAVQGTVDEMHDYADWGDYCALRDAMAEHHEVLSGIAVYDEKHAAWSAKLATEEAQAEMVIGDKLITALAKKEKSGAGKAYALLERIVAEHPDSFYADEADDEIARIEMELDKFLDGMEDIDDMGDFFTLYARKDEGEDSFAGVPRFDEANAEWSARSKDDEVKASLSAGKAYAGIFEDVAELNEKLKKASQKDAKISNATKRAKAEERTMASHLKKLESLAGKLEKMAEKHKGTYYGRAARDSFEAYVASERKLLTDKRER